NGYDVLCDKEPILKKIPNRFGTPQQWNYLLKSMGNSNFSYVIEKKFGSSLELENNIKEYITYSSNRQWLYFVALSVLGAKKNRYLQQAVFNTAHYNEFVKSLFRTILMTDKSDPLFWELYNERKALL